METEENQLNELSREFCRENKLINQSSILLTLLT